VARGLCSFNVNMKTTAAAEQGRAVICYWFRQHSHSSFRVPSGSNDHIFIRYEITDVF
jgi:hypothetical protein